MFAALPTARQEQAPHGAPEAEHPDTIETRLWLEGHECLYGLLRSSDNVSPTFRFPDLISACVSLVFAQDDAAERVFDFLGSQLVLRTPATPRRRESMWRQQYDLLLAALIDVAYLTGQRIGDLLELRWQRDDDEPDAPHVTDAGLRFRPSKTRAKTGATVVIQWSQRLRDAVERLRRLQSERLLKRRASQRLVSGYLFTAQDGKAITYSGAISAWKRAVKRAGVRGVHFHDLRAKALTDKDHREGMQAARIMGTHSTEAQTADYVRAHGARETGATR